MRNILTSFISVFLLATLIFLGIATAQSTTPSTSSATTSLSGTLCSAWNSIAVPNEQPIIGATVIMGIGVIGYEAFRRTHLKQLAEQGESDKSPDDLSKLMSSTMTVIIGTILVVVAIIGAFAIMDTMVCK